MSLFARDSSSTFACSSWFTVCSSSFSDCISSFEVVSSSLVALQLLVGRLQLLVGRARSCAKSASPRAASQAPGERRRVRAGRAAPRPRARPTSRTGCSRRRDVRRHDGPNPRSDSASARAWTARSTSCVRPRLSRARSAADRMLRVNARRKAPYASSWRSPARHREDVQVEPSRRGLGVLAGAPADV